jgi:AcrR family transcriptional regulator
MGARPKQTQKRRTQMLEAAAEVIGERGLCDTRIADIAERAGLSPALVVYYFGSKEKVLTEALAYAEDLFYIEAFRELTGIEGASEKLVRLIELACPAVERSETDEYWALWVELWSRALRNDEAARKREALDQRGSGPASSSRATPSASRRTSPRSWTGSPFRACCTIPPSTAS